MSARKNSLESSEFLRAVGIPGEYQVGDFSISYHGSEQFNLPVNAIKQECPPAFLIIARMEEREPGNYSRFFKSFSKYENTPFNSSSFI